MTKRFTSGGVGRFTFETANRILDAADRVEGLPIAERGLAILDPKPTIVARLVADMSANSFTAELNRDFRVWEWNEVSVADDPADTTRRKMVQLGGAASALHGPDSSGLAVCIGGQATLNDIVILHPMRNIATQTTPVMRASERWYAFTAPAAVDTSVLLWISSAPAALGGIYQVRPEVRIGTQYNPHPFMPPGPAINLYEFGRHGQKIVFTNPNSSLQQDGFVSGHVLGRPINQAGQPLLYAFDMAYPVRPACG